MLCGDYGVTNGHIMNQRLPRRPENVWTRPLELDPRNLVAAIDFAVAGEDTVAPKRCIHNMVWSLFSPCRGQVAGASRCLRWRVHDDTAYAAGSLSDDREFIRLGDFL